MLSPRNLHNIRDIQHWNKWEEGSLSKNNEKCSCAKIFCDWLQHSIHTSSFVSSQFYKHKKVYQILVTFSNIKNHLEENFDRKLLWINIIDVKTFWRQLAWSFDGLPSNFNPFKSSWFAKNIKCKTTTYWLGHLLVADFSFADALSIVKISGWIIWDSGENI